ncbi:hypothetical protein EYY60_09760 [Flavobacterium zhairuonense]|uniref:hypothetical protein n=1 Tax=Flavobacterium zhairuonense TaxID=2493631 RepID=UPI0010447001|nr:hypothetical protein [Flavobacterium zhairuonense]KAF2510785.1 hypothetical protein EYY60_09760 [Flavobacterium zhairuonense]
MDELLMMDYEISYSTLLFVFLFVFGMFYPIFRITKTVFKRIFIFLFVLSYFIYSGIGISILNDDGQYLFFFIFYTIVLVFSFFIFRNSTIKIKLNDIQIESIIDKYGLFFIFIYNFCLVSLLFFPEFKLLNLISPPRVDASSMMEGIQGKKESGWFSFVNVFINILVPFYYMALIKFKKRPFFLLFFLVLPIYINYCYSSYAARTTMVLTFILFVSLLYYYNEAHRRIIVISSLVFLFFSVSFLTTYQSLRMGVEVTDIPFSTAVDGLFRIECTFPTWFHTIYDYASKNDTHIGEYLIWFITQPIPGFLKSWITDFNQNVSIAELLLGMGKDDSLDFFVPLTGIIGESVFVFGRYLFFLHAILIGAVLNTFINFLESRNSFKVLMIYSIIYIGLAIGRAGSTGAVAYPYMLKTMVYVPFLLFVLNLKFKK